VKSFSENEVITGCQRNERKWQEILYKTYFDKMFFMVRSKLPDDDTALEVLNMGFLKVYQKITSFRGEGSFEGWIRRLIYNTMIDYFKDNKKYRDTFELGDYTKVAVLEENTLDGLYFEDIISCLDHLPPATSEVFKYYVLDGMNHKEISGFLNISEGTSKWHLSEAKKRLRQILQQVEKSSNS
jgi:RNA polymerase sigma-70 factor (ECF subfamily)